MPDSGTFHVKQATGAIPFSCCTDSIGVVALCSEYESKVVAAEFDAEVCGAPSPVLHPLFSFRWWRGGRGIVRNTPTPYGT